MPPDARAQANHDRPFPGSISKAAFTDPELIGIVVLVVGATGSIGRHVVEVALEKGYSVRALVRSKAKAERMPKQVRVILGDVTVPETLSAAVEGVDAVVFTLGSDGQGKAGAEMIDYGGVRNVLMALGGRQARIALMTSIGVTDRSSSYNRSTESHDWKRRAERLVRASGMPHTIVRPGWFDYNGPSEHKLVFLQGDERHTGTPKDGVIARRQIAEVLVASLSSPGATGKTFELIAVAGPAQQDMEPLFAALDADKDGSLDAARDIDNQPFEDEPERVRDDVKTVLALGAAGH
ncbi:MAG: SDR family oxidoreductase [Paludibaculum sp.]